MAPSALPPLDLPAASAARKEPHEPPLRARRRQAQRHAPAGRRAVRRRDLGLGQPQAGAPAGHRLPGHHRRRALSRAPAPSDVAEQVAKPIERSIGGVAAAGDPPVDLGQLDRPGRRPVRVRDGRQGDGRRDPGEPRPGPACRPSVDAPGRRRSTSTPRRSSSPRSPRRARTAWRTPPRSPGPRSCPSSRRSRASPRVDLTGGLEQQVARHARPGEARRGQRVEPAGRRRPPGQQPDGPVGPAVGRRARRSRSRRSAGSTSVDEIADLVVGFDAGGPGRHRRARTPASPAPGTQPSAAPAAPTPVTLGDLGTVEDAGVATTGFARTNGQPALTPDRHQDVDGQHRPGRRRRSRRSSPRSARSHPGRSRSRPSSDLSSFIKESHDGLLREGGLGALFAVAHDLPVPRSASARRSSRRSASRSRS